MSIRRNKKEMLSINNSDVLIGGVDEAGRGSIIGPLIVAGISVKESVVSKLRKIGVRDSKILAPQTRAVLFSQIIHLVDSLCIYKIDCSEVDDSVFLNRLNKLEAEAMALVINNIQADKIYIDSCDVNPKRYRDCIECLLTPYKPKLYSMHRADSLNTVVSAASIIAKVVRDKEIQKIREIHHNIGSGYPSDEKTMRFITTWVARYKCAPQFARKSWKPLKIMLEECISYHEGL